jgi:hypothetical protein
VKIISIHLLSLISTKENFCLGRIISQLPGKFFQFWIIGNNFFSHGYGGKLIKKDTLTPQEGIRCDFFWGICVLTIEI